MDCKNCTKEPATVPFVAAESESFRAYRTTRWMALIFAVSLLLIVTVATISCQMVCEANKACIDKVEAINQHWIDYLSEYDFSADVYEYAQDGRGINIIGEGNAVDGGAANGPTAASDGSEADTQGQE